MTDLESYVVDTIHLCSVAVPDAFFGLPGGPATLTFSGIPHEIRFIDLSLATGQEIGGAWRSEIGARGRVSGVCRSGSSLLGCGWPRVGC